MSAASAPALPGPLSPAAGAREALYATVGLLVVLGVGKSAQGLLPYGPDFVFTAAAAFQLYGPLWLIQRADEAPESHAIHVHGLLLGPVAALRRRVVHATRRTHGARALRAALAHYGRGARFEPRALGGDVGRALLVGGLTFPAFALGHHLWRTQVLGVDAGWTLQIPPDLLDILFKNTLLVGLPEEMFYRGFLETRLERLWPTRRTVLGVPLGRTVFLASGLFALGHFVGEWNPARLGPFFPAFLFSALTRRSGSITGAVLYHGLANAFSATLLAGYR